MVDAQLPVGIATTLREMSFQAEHVREIGLERAFDRELWSYAEEHHEIIISKDEDFVYLRQSHPGTFPKLVWIRLGNCSNAQLVKRLHAIWPDVLASLSAGESLVEIV